MMEIRRRNIKLFDKLSVVIELETERVAEIGYVWTESRRAIIQAMRRVYCQNKLSKVAELIGVSSSTLRRWLKE